MHSFEDRRGFLRDIGMATIIDAGGLWSFDKSDWRPFPLLGIRGGPR